ncbi:hypothetical protein PC112_g1512 [Phytophthora cactorum]|nr:hypothetical protein PC112_g1512 [Phytophthora cactorum]
MKVVVLVSALFTQLMLPCPATKFDPHYFRPIARVDLSEGVEAETGNDLVTPIICASTAATAFLGFECTSSTSSSSSSKAAATVSHTATYDLHALAIGDWGVDLGLGSCCNVYRKTGTGNKEYYKDQQAQINVAHLLTLSAKKLQPKVILGHGDNFYWNGLGSDDVNYRFLNSFEAMYSDPALLNIKWFNVAGNHDIVHEAEQILLRPPSLSMEFQECFSLLASRPAHAHEHCEQQQHAEDKPQDVNGVENEETVDSNESADLTQLSARALVQAFHGLQETRVQIYAEFRLGFQVHQKTEQFPAFCSGITERFSVVSEQINQVENLLRDKKQQIVADFIRKVQLEEKEKLLLTSAVLIEKMRLTDAMKQPKRDESTVAFLERSVETLNGKHTDSVVRINEILDDLRAESADLDD